MSKPDRILLAVTILVTDAVFFVVPLAGLVAAYVIVARPPWFRDWTARLYRDAV